MNKTIQFDPSTGEIKTLDMYINGNIPFVRKILKYGLNSDQTKL